MVLIKNIYVRMSQNHVTQTRDESQPTKQKWIEHHNFIITILSPKLIKVSAFKTQWVFVVLRI